MDKIKLTIILMLFAVLCTAAYGQVTVGPVEGALLDIKENDAATGGATASKGLLMPRVKLTQKKQLYPMFLKNPDNQASGPNDDYAGTKKSDQDKKHIGLVVYNVDNTNGLDLGVHSWDGEQWVAVKSGGGSGTTYNGGYPIVVKNDNIYLATTEENSSTPLATGSILRFDGADWVVVVPVDNDTQYTGSASIAVDASTNVISVKDEGVTTAKIKGGTDGQVLTTDASGKAVWAPLKSSEGPLKPETDGKYYLKGGSGAYIVATKAVVTQGIMWLTSVTGVRITDDYKGPTAPRALNLTELYGRTNEGKYQVAVGQSGIGVAYIIPLDDVVVTPGVDVVVVKL